MHLKVSKLGLFNLINFQEYSCFINGIASIEMEVANITKNYKNYKVTYGEEKAVKRMVDVLNMKKIEELRGYQLNIIDENNGFSIIMPNGDKLKFISLEEKVKEHYQDSELYHFMGIILESRREYTDAQGILLIPLDRDKKEYVGEFLSEVIYKNYFFEGNVPCGRDFVFASENIRNKYPFLPVLIQIERFC